jgi:hypothetical protein
MRQGQEGHLQTTSPPLKERQCDTQNVASSRALGLVGAAKARLALQRAADAPGEILLGVPSLSLSDAGRLASPGDLVLYEAARRFVDRA